jgi:hypothetical protein
MLKEKFFIKNYIFILCTKNNIFLEKIIDKSEKIKNLHFSKLWFLNYCVLCLSGIYILIYNENNTYGNSIH